MIYGKDVSNYNGNFNWTDESFGFAKATEGTSFQDAYFKYNWDSMWTRKILRGAYHFGHPSGNPAAQAAYFVSYVRSHGLLSNDVLVLDLEVTDNLSPARVSAWASAFIKNVQSVTGKNVWVYTYHEFIAAGNCSGLQNQPLWIASITGAGNVGNIAPWPVWTCQQYGTAGGVDINVLNGDAPLWGQLANLPQPGPQPYPAPAGLSLTSVSVAVKWNPVAVDGKPVPSYTVEAVGQNGKTYQSLVTAQPSAVLDGLVPGWEYEIRVYANGGPVAPSGASIKVTA